MAERYEYFFELVLVDPVDLLALDANAADLGRKGFRLVGSSPLVDPERGTCLLLFWERPLQSASAQQYPLFRPSSRP